MKLRRMGNSGVAVSALALGTMTFGNETAPEDALQILDVFAEEGGTFIDTADVYADGASEEIVGEWLRTRPSDVVNRTVLATKGRFPTSALDGSEGASRRHLRRALEQSLRRLGTDHVDLFLVHSWDPLTPIDETMDFLDSAVRDGLTDYIGVSNYLGWQIQRAVRACESRGYRRPTMLQPAYSLLAREIEWEILPSAAEAGMGVMAWSPLAGGWLTGKYSPGVVPSGGTRLGEDPGRGVEAYEKNARLAQTWEVLAAVERIAAAHETTQASVALAWVMARDGVTSAIIGARTLDQLRENLAAERLSLTAAELEELDAVSAPVSRTWPYGPDGQAQRSRSLSAE